MNERPSDDARDETDDVYRRTAALDPSRPSESARRSILDHAARLAAERSAERRPTDITTARRAPRRQWRPAIVGTLAAALLAGLVVIPRLWTPPSRNSVSEKKAPGPAAPAQALEYAAQRAAAAKAAAPASAPAPAPPAADAALDRSSGRLAEVTSAGRRAAPALQARQLGDPTDALRRAAKTGDLGALNQSLGLSADVNGRDDAGRTALMLAILNGHGDAVDALLAHGADPNAADAKGTTPLAAAMGRADPSIAAALRRAGARENQ